MTTFRKYLASGIVAIGLAAGSVAALADGPGCGHMGGPMGYGGHGRDSEQMKARMEKRATELHDKLKLNASQESAWRSYLAKMTPPDMRPYPDRAELEKLPAPERMERMHALMKERMKERETHMASRVAATKEFYDVLTPEQRKIFDEHFRFGPGGHRRAR